MSDGGVFMTFFLRFWRSAGVLAFLLVLAGGCFVAGNAYAEESILLNVAYEPETGDFGGDAAGTRSPPPATMSRALALRNKKGETLPEFSKAWARVAASGGATAIFFELNGGKEDDRIVAVATPWAQSAYMQRTIRRPDGRLTAQRVETAFVPAGVHAKFTPDTLYVVLEGLKRSVGADSLFPVFFEFEKAGIVRTMVTAYPAED